MDCLAWLDLIKKCKSEHQCGGFGGMWWPGANCWNIAAFNSQEPQYKFADSGSSAMGLLAAWHPLFLGSARLRIGHPGKTSERQTKEAVCWLLGQVPGAAVQCLYVQAVLMNSSFCLKQGPRRLLRRKDATTGGPAILQKLRGQIA